jgi:hypothetical protein
MHISQAKIATLEAVGELLVIDAEQVQDGSVQIVNMHGTIHDMEA